MQIRDRFPIGKIILIENMLVTASGAMQAVFLGFTLKFRAAKRASEQKPLQPLYVRASVRLFQRYVAAALIVRDSRLDLCMQNLVTHHGKLFRADDLMKVDVHGCFTKSDTPFRFAEVTANGVILIDVHSHMANQ